MTDDSIGQDANDRSPPITGFLSSECFYKTGQHAHAAHDSDTLRLQFKGPLYYLYCHALELAMKAFLRAKGMSSAELRGPAIRHSLLNLWKECLTRQLALDFATQNKVGEVIRLLTPYATDHEFRYVRTGFNTLPTLDEVRDAAAELIEAVRPTCEATVSGRSC